MPAAPDSARSGPSLLSGRPGLTEGAAGTEPGARPKGSCESGLSSTSSAVAQPERRRSSPGRRGRPAPSPQPGRGSDDWDISWKLFAAGGGGVRGVVGRGRAQRVRSEAKESLSEVLCHCLQFCIYFFPLESEIFQW